MIRCLNFVLNHRSYDFCAFCQGLSTLIRSTRLCVRASAITSFGNNLRYSDESFVCFCHNVSEDLYLNVTLSAFVMVLQRTSVLYIIIQGSHKCVQSGPVPIKVSVELCNWCFSKSLHLFICLQLIPCCRSQHYFKWST